MTEPTIVFAMGSVFETNVDITESPPPEIRRRISGMNCCSHLSDIGNVIPKTPNGCEECLKMGDEWIHLRLCLTCGHVGCCEDSKNKHATKHFHSTNHPLIKSFEPGEDWGWCYVDDLFLESVPGSLTTEWCGALGATP